MPMEIAKKTVDWLLSEDVSGPTTHVDVTFFGGEPLLEMKNIKEIIPYARKAAEAKGKSIGFSATTNGVAFTKETAEYWKDNDLGILLSCDGILEAHDTFRRTRSGEGSFRLVERNIENILSASKSKEVRMTITPQTAGYAAEGVGYLMKRGFESISVFYVEEMTWKDENLLKFESEFYDIGELLISSIESGKSLKISPLDGRIKALLGPEFSNEDLNDGTCGAGKGYLGVGVDGVIYPCHRFVSSRGFKGAYPIGDIYKGFDEKRRVPFLRMKKKLLLGCDIECDECGLYGKCSGGCLAANYENTGHLFMRPPSSRFHELIWLEVAQSIIDYFKKKELPAFKERFMVKNKESMQA